MKKKIKRFKIYPKGMAEYVGTVRYPGAAKLDTSRRSKWTAVAGRLCIDNNAAKGYIQDAFTHQQDRATLESDPSGP